jgi:ABC-type nitrate/sulfonate/bicarbonate transport system substrate-binding protein
MVMLLDSKPPQSNDAPLGTLMWCGSVLIHPQTFRSRSNHRCAAHASQRSFFSLLQLRAYIFREYQLPIVTESFQLAANRDAVVRAVTGILAMTAYAASNSPSKARELVSAIAAEAREAIDDMYEVEKASKLGPHRPD